MACCRLCTFRFPPNHNIPSRFINIGYAMSTLQNGDTLHLRIESYLLVFPKKPSTYILLVLSIENKETAQCDCRKYKLSHLAIIRDVDLDFHVGPTQMKQQAMLDPLQTLASVFSHPCLLSFQWTIERITKLLETDHYLFFHWRQSLHFSVPYFVINYTLNILKISSVNVCSFSKLLL